MKPDPPEKQETVAKDEAGGEAPGVLIQDVGISPQDLQEAKPQELQEAGWEAGWDKYGVWWSLMKPFQACGGTGRRKVHGVAGRINIHFGNELGNV